MAAYCLQAVPLAFLCLGVGDLYLEKYPNKKTGRRLMKSKTCLDYQLKQDKISSSGHSLIFPDFNK